MDTQGADWQHEIKTEDLLFNFENEKPGRAHVNTVKSSSDFGKEAIMDEYSELQSAIQEAVDIKVEIQPTCEGLKYEYGLCTDDHFVKPEFIAPEELAIKVEAQEASQSNTKPKTDEDFNEVTWFQCPECPYRTTVKKYLMSRHILIHRKDLPMHKCTLCSYESPSKTNLSQHFHRRHNSEDIELFSCPEEGCSLKTRYKSCLRRHISLVHQRNKIFKCLQCSYQTNYAHIFREHKLWHENPDKWFSCPLCPYKTPNRILLNSHALQHKSDNEIKWFQCSECSFRTKRKYILNQHNLVHNRVLKKEFGCSECCYKTTTARYLQQHLLKHKEPVSKRLFKCSHCPYKATLKSHLKQHSYTHKSVDEIQKWFRCPTCPYKSHRNGHLKQHQLVHKKPEEGDEIHEWFRCPACPYKSRRKGSLVRHRLIHKKPEETDWYYCYLCMWKTHTKNKLAGHIRQKHRDVKGQINSGLRTDDNK